MPIITKEEKELTAILKPCPLCGSSVTLTHTNDNHRSPFIRCNNDFNYRAGQLPCELQTRPWTYKTAEEAAVAWNRRVAAAE